MIAAIGGTVLFAVIILAGLIPTIVFLDRNAAYRTARALAVAAVVLVCVVLAGAVVLVVADSGART